MRPPDGLLYAKEKLSSAVNFLSSAGKLTLRLYGAWDYIRTLRGDNFPSGPLREAWEELQNRFTLFEGVAGEGDVQATLYLMSHEEAQSLASAIKQLFAMVSSYEHSGDEDEWEASE